jgi:hypothetical protein
MNLLRVQSKWAILLVVPKSALENLKFFYSLERVWDSGVGWLQRGWHVCWGF